MEFIIDDNQVGQLDQMDTQSFLALDDVDMDLDTDSTNPADKEVPLPSCAVRDNLMAGETGVIWGYEYSDVDFGLGHWAKAYKVGDVVNLQAVSGNNLWTLTRTLTDGGNKVSRSWYGVRAESIPCK